MKKLTTNEIRKIWLDFWKDKEHFELESKSLIPYNDESLLFINSGVATLKTYLSGQENPPAKRIVNSQKSLRTNDIENVGVTSRHHTMFEMLGNFSIGDYFKQEAITYAWEILTADKYYGFDKDKLYITVHPDDTDTYNYWLELGVATNKIVQTEDNFWEIGKGPGGPNTEIFFDRGIKYDKRDPLELLQADLETDRVIEIWNIVFSQYNCDPAIKRQDYPELPQKNIDTGMGLERMACVIQDVETNFETDNFKVIMTNIATITKTTYLANKKAYRIIADHIRALSFAISDGVDPSNEGRGYVIRRILRRAVKYAYLDLEITEPFLYQLVEAVVGQMADYYPELQENQKLIEEVVLREEKKFLQTISEGLKHYNLYLKELQNNTISGGVAFKLYDTYGFPLELTQELAAEKNLIVDLTQYNILLEAQKQRARKARKNIVSIDAQNSFYKDIIVASEFIGYHELKTQTPVVMIIKDNVQVSQALMGEEVLVVLEQTPFYATSGGQEFDLGNSEVFEVLSVVKLPNGQHLHEVKVLQDFKVNDIVNVSVDIIRRKAIQKNHSATHLLHYALTQILGTSVKQAGSSQDAKRTRFDYTTHEAPTFKQLIAIQKLVNDCIKQQLEVSTKVMSLEAAKQTGAKALFSDKYGAEVRVVTMGNSVELCGGTHVKNTKEIEKFLIVSEQSIGSGVRRIEALTSTNVEQYVDKIKAEYIQEVDDIKNIMEQQKVANLEVLMLKYNRLKEVSEIVAVKNMSSLVEITNIQQKNEVVKKSIKEKSENKVSELVKTLVEIKKVNTEGIVVIEENFQNLEVKTLKLVVDKLLEQVKTGIVILGTINDNKITIVVKVSEDLTTKYHAGKILNEKLKAYNGKGGGKPTMAQGGGTVK
ncbi:MAG: alanine--tRNA ligase [Mycoplasmatales bacterium]